MLVIAGRAKPDAAISTVLINADEKLLNTRVRVRYSQPAVLSACTIMVPKMLSGVFGSSGKEEMVYGFLFYI